MLGEDFSAPSAPTSDTPSGVFSWHFGSGDPTGVCSSSTWWTASRRPFPGPRSGIYRAALSAGMSIIATCKSSTALRRGPVHLNLAMGHGQTLVGCAILTNPPIPPGSTMWGSFVDGRFVELGGKPSTVAELFALGQDARAEDFDVPWVQAAVAAVAAVAAGGSRPRSWSNATGTSVFCASASPLGNANRCQRAPRDIR